MQANAIAKQIRKLNDITPSDSLIQTRRSSINPIEDKGKQNNLGGMTPSKSNRMAHSISAPLNLNINSSKTEAMK